MGNINGPRINGSKINGPRINGSKINGSKINGLKINRSEINGLEIKGSSINRPGTERLLKLGTMLRDMLDKQYLCINKSKTMCLLCTGCDLTPHRDI
jgi:biotin synthase-related radical SAM superfamily protein